MTTTSSVKEKSRAVTDPKDRMLSSVRKDRSGPALNAFFKIVDTWRLGTNQQISLLGYPSHQTFYNWKKGSHGSLPYDTLIRISLILGVYKALHILYPEKEFADGWVQFNNTNIIFGGKKPIDLMVEDGINGLYTVRRLLDSRRGGWN